MSSHALITPLISTEENVADNDCNLEICRTEENTPPLARHFKTMHRVERQGLHCKTPTVVSTVPYGVYPNTTGINSTSSDARSESSSSTTPSVTKDLDSGFGTPEFIPDQPTATPEYYNIPSTSSCVVINEDDTGPSTSYDVGERRAKFRRWRNRTIPRPLPPPMLLSRVIMLAASFFFIYSAMNSISEYVTSLLPDNLGDQSLFLLQTTVCASTLAAPSIVSVLGELRAMMLGGVTHVIYLAVLMQPSRSFVLGASALCGFGASASWVAQGTYLTRCSPPEKRGLFTGVFWGMYYAADIVGNLTAYTLFKYLSQNAMFAMGACSALVGVLLLLFMEEKDLTLQQQQELCNDSSSRLSASNSSDNRRSQDILRPSSSSSIMSGSTETGEETLSFGTCERCGNPPKMEVLQLYRRSSWGGLLLFLLLMPMLFYSGCESAFWTGEYTKLLPTNTIGLVLLCTGLGQFFGSFLLGWLSDFFNCHTPTFLVGVLASATGLFTCIPLQKASEESDDPIQPRILGTPVIAFLGALSFGVADGVLTTHTFAITGRIFPGKKPEIWAVFNLLSNGGAASTYWFGMIFPVLQGGMTIQLWAQALILTVGTPLYIIVDIWSASQATLQMHMFRRKRSRVARQP